MEASWFKLRHLSRGYCQVADSSSSQLGAVEYIHRPKQSDVVDPAHPLQGCQFHGLLGLPRSLAVNELSLIKPVYGFGQCVVIAVTTTAH